MQVARSIGEAREAVARARRADDGPVGLVPTMGALHAGHRALLDAARAECSTVVMSLFVNPAQFGETADLEAYPRDEPHDLAVAEAAGVDIVFAPSAAELYPPGFATWVDPGPLAAALEGAHRPGHFRGVATIVLKLLHVVAPDVAYFGQKDAQQVAVIRSVLRDLDVAVRLRVVATVRDRDGLALSSRNATPLAGRACAGPGPAARPRHARPRRRPGHPAGGRPRARLRRGRRSRTARPGRRGPRGFDAPHR